MNETIIDEIYRSKVTLSKSAMPPNEVLSKLRKSKSGMIIADPESEHGAFGVFDGSNGCRIIRWYTQVRCYEFSRKKS